MRLLRDKEDCTEITGVPQRQVEFPRTQVGLHIDKQGSAGTNEAQLRQMVLHSNQWYFLETSGTPQNQLGYQRDTWSSRDTSWALQTPVGLHRDRWDSRVTSGKPHG